MLLIATLGSTPDPTVLLLVSVLDRFDNSAKFARNSLLLKLWKFSEKWVLYSNRILARIVPILVICSQTVDLMHNCDKVNTYSFS